MRNKNIILSILLMFSPILLALFSVVLFSGCSSNKVAFGTFKQDIVEVNKKVNFLHKKLMPKKLISKECKLQKKNLLKLQKENLSTIDKVFRLNNLLSYTEFSRKNKKEIENSLDNALQNLFSIRQESKKRLLILKSLKIDDNRKYLCSLEIEPIQKTEACIDCRAVFN